MTELLSVADVAMSSSIALALVALLAHGRRRRSLMPLVTTLAVCLGLSTCVSAQTLFSDTFESDLSQWVGKSGGGHNAIIVDDSLRAGNHVVTFTALNRGGDIYGPEVSVTPGQNLVLSFEYLGIPSLGGNAGDLGGFIGIAEDTPNTSDISRWLAGTVLWGSNTEDDPLIDDGQWHAYTIEFDPFAFRVPINNTIQVMLEDFIFSGGVPGDVFFDNVDLSLIGQPSTLALVDIKPGSFPNSVNLKSKGVLPVAILSTDEFDVNDVDIDSLLFGDPLLIDNGGTAVSPLRSAFEDVSGDGLLDLTLKFRTADLVEHGALGPNTLDGILIGLLLDGTPFEGMDSIRIVPPKGSSGNSLRISAVPEPTTCGLALAALCLAMSRRRSF